MEVSSHTEAAYHALQDFKAEKIINKNLCLDFHPCDILQTPVRSKQSITLESELEWMQEKALSEISQFKSSLISNEASVFCDSWRYKQINLIRSVFLIIFM